ncbi:MAG: family 43 glycosylhydrolase [Clostridia bacterium]|nr:family 43 glycosylhydrolase [Clostridia bacterium]
MTKLFKYSLITVLFVLMIVGASAKETVIIDDDFSTDALYQYTLKGNWVVSDGVLKLGSGSGSAYLFYDIPSQYEGCNYKIDVDFIGHTSTGGILVGGTGEKLTPTAVDFHGFDCFLGNNGKKAAIGCYKETGAWSGNFVVSDDVVTASDIHLSVEVYDNEITYRVTSIDGNTLYYGITYTLGTSSRDVYDAFGSNLGLRKFYADKGSFDNLKVTVIEDDKLPSLSKSIDFCNFAFKVSSGLKIASNIAIGSGVMLTDTALADNFKAELTLSPKGNSKIFFGMTDVNNGYAFEIDKYNETLAFYKITNGKYNRLGVKNMPFYDGEHLAYVSVTDGIATVMYDTFFEKEDAFWSFSLKLDGYKAGRFGVMLDGGSVKGLTVTETNSITGETYTNPVNWGPDPDVLFYDGTYYLYNRITSGDDIFRVYTSSDMTKWVARNVVFTNDPSVHNVQHYMSPNVLYYDGTFYLFYAAKNAAGSNRLYCATSDSPYGPFTHKHGQVPLHEVAEIGGHPYFDADTGKVYLTYVRFGNGNHIWIEEVTLANDKATPVSGTLTKLISPNAEYENDGFGHIAEGGVIYKHNGYYYMIYASGHYEGHYGEAYAISENILGPYKKYEYNDILTWNKHIDGTGDGIFVSSPDGTELWMVYHKHYEVGTVSPRYTCIDKIKFVADPNGGPDILTVQGPSTTPQEKPSNIYRYDIDRNGTEMLYDAMQLLNKKFTSYSGAYDVDGSNRNDEYDARAIINELVK